MRLRAAYKVAPEALWELGAEVVKLGVDPDGFNINKDCGSTAPGDLIRKVNEVHHHDESRHIAFGRQIVAMLHADLRDRLPADRLAALEQYLKRYMRSSVDSICEPLIYRDAGIPEPYAVRRKVLADPAYPAFVQRVLNRTESFMLNSGIFDAPIFADLSPRAVKGIERS